VGFSAGEARHNRGRSEGFEEREKPVRRSISAGSCVVRSGAGERSFLEGAVSVDITVDAAEVGVAQKERDAGNVNACLE
jgi:hypothetical protein